MRANNNLSVISYGIYALYITVLARGGGKIWTLS